MVKDYEKIPQGWEEDRMTPKTESAVNTKQAWTPGPWKLTHSGYANAPFVLYVRDVDPNYNRRYPLQGVDWIAEIRDDESPDHPRYEANAKLIAKAPELFDALLELHRFTHNCPIELHERIERILREAGAL